MNLSIKLYKIFEINQFNRIRDFLEPANNLESNDLVCYVLLLSWSLESNFTDQLSFKKF